MPVQPGSWDTGPVTAKALNTALYSIRPGNNHKPNGILFLANRPLLVEGLSDSSFTQPSSSGGTFKSVTGTGVWTSYFDSSVLFGPGADGPAGTATGTFTPIVFASDGTAGDTPGGYYLTWGFPGWTETRNAGASGAGLLEAGSVTAGGAQFSGTARPNCSYALDIAQVPNPSTLNLMGYCSDSSGSSFTYTSKTGDYSGPCPRYYTAWAGISTGAGTVAAVPSPTVWAAGGTVTSALLNGAAVNNPLTLLNAPPTLRAGSLLATSITSGTAFTVPIGTPQADTYSAYTVSSRTWTVPLSGVYLVHAMVYYAAGATSSMYAGITVNGSLVLYGPACQSGSTGNTAPQMTRLLDLQAGDTVKLVTYSNAPGNTLGSAYECRLVTLWMSALAPSDGAWSWTPPATGYRWQAGTPGTALTAAFAAHLTNDLSFLLQRPYLLAYQGTAQAGLSQNVFHTVTMDTVQGRAHASAGDPYSGWHSGASNYYEAPVAGWYLVQAGYFQSVPGTTPASCTAGILQSPAGITSPDQYQEASTVTTSLSPGAEAIGMYYLRAGDTVAPQYRQQDGGTFSTNASAGRESCFGVMWMGNLTGLPPFGVAIENRLRSCEQSLGRIRVRHSGRPVRRPLPRPRP